MTQQVTRENHFVSQALMRRWSIDGVYVWAYRLLVPHVNVPDWELRPVRQVARHRDLYTTVDEGMEDDAIERWLSVEVEQPGLEASEKLVAGGHLTPSDWRSVQKLVVAQDVRTPFSFADSMSTWSVELPSMLQGVLEEAQSMSSSDRDAVVRSSTVEPFPRSIVKVDIEGDEGDRQMVATVLAGRRMWLWKIKHVLTNTVRKIPELRWGLLFPAAGEEWPLSDHPVLRLNFYANGKYDFGGGWGNPGSEIMMPLSPRALLYTQVGTNPARRATLNKERTRLLQRLLVERGHRAVIATEKLGWVSEFRPRIVNAARFENEARVWEGWHNDQVSAETSP